MQKCYILTETYIGGNEWDEDDTHIIGVYQAKQDAVNAAYDLNYPNGDRLPNHTTEIIESEYHPSECC